ncbi:hypothetical protein M407DRAFT_211162 [Tulasnella calospora MUT 4182]|uniref:NYN domain-containing protein n=1 Tax=Tulasnella calospora MUT 4182 TaxID=1051891 RepID=A0A0C3QFT8_9AGAM|nr:hypothetical protein M407DRAFT_211162 [Tulasnella calospora MUT 4182]
MTLNFVHGTENNKKKWFQLCPPPPGMSGAAFTNKIRNELCRQNARHFGLFKVYTTSTTRIPEPFKTELRNSGADICEGDGSAADKIRRAVDILTWGLTAHHPAVTLFISSDPDFASVISALRNRGCRVNLLLHPDAPSSILLDHGVDVLEWKQVFNQAFGDNPAKESALHTTSDDQGVTNSIRQSDSVPLQAPREVELPPPNYDPPTVLRDSLIRSSPQTPSRESDEQESEPSSSQPGLSPASDTNQTTRESSTQQTTVPNPPPQNFEPFRHLVQVLEELNDGSSQWHAWGTVSNRLIELDPDVYKKLGFRRFRPYIQVASKEANIVSIKEPKGGDGEVSLNAREIWNV